MSGIAVIGWGSLIWDLEILAPHVDGAWRMRRGPQLPLEFSRVSPKRRMGLVVCLDPEHGVACHSHWTMSRRERLDDAIADLARRERAPTSLIGHVELRGVAGRGRLPPVVRAVRDWCAVEGLAGAVWTDLESNFQDHLGEGFSIPRALTYLATLEGTARDEAVRYIENAPIETDTPLRRALGAETWWQAHAERLRGTPSPPQGDAPS